MLVCLLSALPTAASAASAHADHHHHHHHDHHAHAARAAGDGAKGPHDICWSGDPRWCEATAGTGADAKAAPTPASVPDAMLPTCARASGTNLFADGFEPSGTGGPVGAASAWSDPATWGGSLPQAGQSVSIPAGRTVVLDVPSPALATLTIEGNLIAAHDRDAVLSAEIIMVHGGSLRIGCADDPYLRNATITLTGAPSNASPHDMGTKVLGAMAGGRIELHGRPVRGWTRLAANTAAGATQVSVVDAAGWRVGDRVVVASGSTEPNQAEARSISAISGNTLTLDQPLATPRLGVLRTVDGRVLDLRTEVGLLSRNITVQGDTASDATRFGGHMMTMAGSQVRIDGVRFLRMGQFDRLGRYPFHWHIVGDASGQYVRNSAVDGSFQRGIVVHATRNAEVAGNVVFDTIGHNYVIEDPAAIGNTLRDNLGVKTRIAFMTDPGLVPQNDDQASNFWIRAARNTFTGNVAAGAEANGFWFDHTPDSPTTFTGNAAHSSAARGDHVVFNRQSGLLVENAIDNPAAPPLVFDGTLVHRNANGLWPTNEAEAAAQTHRNTVFADHALGFPMVSEAVGSLIVFEDPLFVGDSAGPAPADGRPPPVHLQYGAAVSLVRPVFANWGSRHLMSATDIFADWQADFAVSGARFVATAPTAATFQDGTVLHAVDDSYLPRGLYVDARWPALAGPGAVAVTVGETLALRSPGLLGHAFIKLRAGNAEVASNGTAILRSDGLRFSETGSAGWRIAYGAGLSYRFEALPSNLAEFSLRLDLVGGMVRAGAGEPRTVLVLPAARAPLGLFRPSNDADGNPLPPSSANALQSAASLADFEANPLTRYWYDATARTVRFTASERWVVLRP
jgi:hypothetical protein